jgi:sensor histidine kinase YesM
VIAIGAVGLTVLLAVILSNGLISRINTMVGAVHQIQSGDFSVHKNVQGNDEIDELAGNINLMSARINELINTVYRAETLQKETEIRALQAQINPHFLFNVLETFKMMAELNDDERLADGITSLGQLMRYNVSLSLKPTTLDAELQNLHSYINIQNLILNKRLHVDYDIPEECRSAHVPRLLLQPLVENSIKHGFSSITGNLLIHIKANLLENQLNITLSDNGTGMTGEELDVLCKKVYSPIGDDSSHGVGLWNVNQRLKLIFGRSELQFASNSPGNGFTVIIAIPQLIEGNTEQP